MEWFSDSPIGWLVVAALVFAGLALYNWLWRVWLRWQRRRHDVRQSRTYTQASKDYLKARELLEAKHNAIVVDLIDDLGDVPKGRDQAALHINYEAAMDALNRIRYAKDGPIDVVLHTLGGYSFAAEMVAAALQAHGGRVRAYVPFVAMSGGTMVALAADKIHMGKNAALGPIDSFLGGFSLEDYARLRKEKPIEKIDDVFLLLAYEAEKYHNDANGRACAIIDLAHKKKGKDDCRVVDALMSSNLPHGLRIDVKHAHDIGMNVTEDCPDEVYDLVEARLQMIKASEQAKRRKANGDKKADNDADSPKEWARP